MTTYPEYFLTVIFFSLQKQDALSRTSRGNAANHHHFGKTTWQFQTQLNTYF